MDTAEGSDWMGALCLQWAGAVGFWLIEGSYLPQIRLTEIGNVRS